ncbi:MAG: hypothetical protein CMQ05_15865 [Gammaproteobacteria bacterium]|nr:hypothetical protein [Gammaproteobacteria bacterium]RPG25894.1 MAG: hypothetical protein CBC10_005805 [Gammaproteobacteria bacterium TMED50]
MSLSAADISNQGLADSRATELAINAPITRQVRTRFALLSAEGGQDVAYNQHLDEDTNTANTKQGTFKLRWQNRFLTAD